MYTILSVGKDAPLLYTRALVLATSGASVTSVSPAEAMLLLSITAFDLIVFCHSMRGYDIQQLCAASRASTHPAKTLLLVIPGATFRPRVDIDARHSLEAGPGRLVKEIRTLLGAEPAETAIMTGPRIMPFVLSWRQAGKSRASREALALQDEPGVIHKAIAITDSKQ